MLLPPIIYFLLLLSFAAVVLADQRNQGLPEVDISDREIYRLVEDLRRADENRAQPSQLRLDYQGHTTTRDSTDNARGRLFERVDEALLRRDTYAKLLALYDNYIFETGVAEVNTQQEMEEVNAFVNSVISTRPMKMLVEFLRGKGHPFAQSDALFRQWFLQLWFGTYSRARGSPDTSGFEHVFLGEAKNGELSGMHSWVRFYHLERSGDRFDYKGFLVKRFNIMSAVKFSYGSTLKRSGSFMVGTSPEFDLSVFTLCFLSRRGIETCDFELDGCPVSVTSHYIVQQHKVFIGSIYPSAGRMTANCRAQNEKRGRGGSL